MLSAAYPSSANAELHPNDENCASAAHLEFDAARFPTCAPVYVADVTYSEMGALEFAYVGAREGARDGAFDGARDGALDGARDGFEVVGDFEGTDVDGARDGADVDGARDGAFDGARDGAFDGARDGAFEGDREGLDVVGTCTATHRRLAVSAQFVVPVLKKPVPLLAEYPIVPVAPLEPDVHPEHVLVVGAVLASAPPVQALTPPAYAQSVSVMGKPLASMDAHVPAT